MLTASSRASIESRPRPLGPNRGRSSPICSAMVCSIRFFTSISLMRLRKSSESLIRPFWRRRRGALQNLDLVRFVAGRDGLIRVGTHCRGRRTFNSRNRRSGRFQLRFARVGLGFTGFVQLVAEFVLCLLKFLHRLTHPACELWKFFRAEEDKNNEQDDDQIWPGQIHEGGNEAHRSQTSDRLPKLQDNSPEPLMGSQLAEDKSLSTAPAELLTVIDTAARLWKTTNPSHMRPIWKGSISFGLVYIPVAVRS